MHCRRQLANERSKKRYRTGEGRRNKKLLNAKRSAAACHEQGQQDAVPSESEPTAPPDTSRSDTSATYDAATQATPDPERQPTQVDLEDHGDVNLVLDGFTLGAATLVNSPLLRYLAMVASLLEGRVIRCEELLLALLRSMRQRSLDRLPRREYVLRFLNQHPP